LIICNDIYVEEYEVLIWSNGILIEQVLAKNKHQHCNISYVHS